MSADYQRGRLDGLREAIDIAEALARGVALRLGREPQERRGWRITRNARRVRQKAFEVAAKRISTVLKRASRRPGNIHDRLEDIGL